MVKIDDSKISETYSAEMRCAMTGYEQTKDDTDLQSIDEIRVAHVAALNSGNAQAWAAQFTNDAVQMPPNAPENIGKPNIRSWSQAFLDQFRVHFALAGPRGGLAHGSRYLEQQPSTSSLVDRMPRGTSSVLRRRKDH